VDIVVTARHCELKERFRVHVAEKLTRLEKLEHRALRVDVEVSREPNPRLADVAERVELTVHSKGPVIRAEAKAADRYAALDLAVERLEARLRKVADRRRVHRGARTPVSVARATARLDGAATRAAPSPGAPSAGRAAGPDGGAGSDPAVLDGVAARSSGPLQVDGDGPLVVREKTHQASPMSLDQALYEMELVGHDFFLFVDADSKQPSVVYRRRGYDYGVIHLEV
jgi:ribosomal subunit interface protein